MSRHSFKITFGNHLALLSWLLIVYSVIGIIFYYFFRLSLKFPIAYVYLWFILADILPTILVHIQYYKANRGVTFEIYREIRELRYTTENENLTYKFDDIVSFVQVISYGAGGWFSFRDYRYFEIVFKDEKRIFVTSLLIKDIKYVLEGYLLRAANKKYRLVAFIRKTPYNLPGTAG